MVSEWLEFMLDVIVGVCGVGAETSPRTKRTMERLRKNEKLAKTPEPRLQGLRVHVDPEVATPDECQRIRTQFGFRRPVVDYEAEMYVVRDPTSAGPLKTCIAILSGCLLANKRYFASGGAGWVMHSL